MSFAEVLSTGQGSDARHKSPGEGSGKPQANSSPEMATLQKRVNNIELDRWRRSFKLWAPDEKPLSNKGEQVSFTIKILESIGLVEPRITSTFTVKEKKGGSPSIIFTVSSDVEAAAIVQHRRQLCKEKAPRIRIFDQLSKDELERKKQVFPVLYNEERRKEVPDGKGGLRCQRVWFRRDKMFVEGKEYILPPPPSPPPCGGTPPK